MINEVMNLALLAFMFWIMNSGGSKSVMGFKKRKRRFQYNKSRSQRCYQISVILESREDFCMHCK